MNNATGLHTMTFKAHYKGKVMDIEANDLLHARNAAAREWHVKPGLAHLIAVVLIAKNKQPVVHSTSEVG